MAVPVRLRVGSDRAHANTHRTCPSACWIGPGTCKDMSASFQFRSNYLASMIGLDPSRPHDVLSDDDAISVASDPPEAAVETGSAPDLGAGSVLAEHAPSSSSRQSVCFFVETGSAPDLGAGSVLAEPIPPTDLAVLATDLTIVPKDLSVLDRATTKAVVVNAWASIVVDTLSPLQMDNLRSRQEIRYGDDCSGARAPYEALSQFVTLLDQAGISMTIEDMFASECPGPDGDGPRKFIDAQCNPTIMFKTVHRGDRPCGMNLRTGMPATIPANLTVYTAGWVCRDVSTMNCHRKPLLPRDHPKVKSGKAGASSQTLDSSIRYIKDHRPDIALLENLANKKNISIAIKALKDVGGYNTCVLLRDSRTFAVPMSRRRMYILAVQTHLLLCSLGQLPSQLMDIAQKIPRRSLPGLLDAAIPGPPSANARLRVAMATGEKVDRKWKLQHDKIRNALGLPTQTEIVNKVKAHSPMATSLPLRCQELLGLHWEVAMLHGIDPRKHHFVWDLTNSAKFSCAKDPRLAGIVPCALRGHCLWDTALGRPLTGVELMRVHGFCLEPCAEQLGNNIISKLAGDTISVPPVGCILALALANTATAPSHVQKSEQQAEHHVPARWVGNPSWHGFDRAKDNLMSLAGLSEVKRARTSRTKRLERGSPGQHLGRNVDNVISLD